MTKAEEIEMLKLYRECIRALREYEADSNTREKIARMKPMVTKIVKRVGTHKIFTIAPPPMMGGPVMDIDPLENLYNIPYGLTHEVLGTVIDMMDETIGVLMSEEETWKTKHEDDIWGMMHPDVIRVAKERFDTKFYADAVEAAFKEINFKVKTLYRDKTNIIKDGVELMFSAFAAKNPVLVFEKKSSYSEYDIQEGYMHMFAGAIQGIRNPKAHENDEIDRNDALRKLAFASMLLYKLDSVEK